MAKGGQPTERQRQLIVVSVFRSPCVVASVAMPCSALLALHMRFIRGLRQDYDKFWNSNTFVGISIGVVAHHCWPDNGCNCKCFEDSVQGMSRSLIRSLLLRRPKAPQIKEWTAVGSVAML